MFTIRPSRQEIYVEDPKFLWKYSVRALAIILAVISTGLIGWSLAHEVVLPTNMDDRYEYADNEWFYSPDILFLLWELIALGLSIIWNIANILVLLSRNRPIHPGANVACDLLLWLGFIVTGAIATVRAENYLWWYPNDYDGFNVANPVSESSNSGSSDSISPDGTLSNITSPTYNPCEGFTSCAAQGSYYSAVHRKGVIIAVGAAISFIVLLVHFALFISACRYTNARRVNVLATVIAEKMNNENVSRDAAGGRNPNAGFVPISEPVEQQAPLGYGMPPAPTGMTVGDRWKMRAVVAEEQQQRRGTSYSHEQPQVVDDEHAPAAYKDNVHEA